MKNYTLINRYESEINSNITSALQTSILTPIIYDEVTNFKDATSYPFEKRKNTLIGNIYHDKKQDQTNFSENEDTVLTKIYLKMDKICYDKIWYSDILFWKDDEYCDENDEEDSS